LIRLHDKCEDIISKLISFVEYSIQFKKPYLQEINKYLSKKSQRDKSKNEPLDNMSKVRNLLLRGKATSAHHHFLEPLVWKVLLRQDRFKDLERLCNFLGNYLQVDIKDDEKVRHQIKNKLLNNKDEALFQEGEYLSTVSGAKVLAKQRFWHCSNTNPVETVETCHPIGRKPASPLGETLSTPTFNAELSTSKALKLKTELSTLSMPVSTLKLPKSPAI
jgi:hypothetical protein